MTVELHNFNDTKSYKQFEYITGVYALIYKGEVIYVGQSCNIRARLLSHHAYKARLNWLRNQSTSEARQLSTSFYTFIKDNLLDIQFLAISVEPLELNKTEEHYITKYKPRFNYAGVVIAY